jgi:nucleotide-binding universal stress UspA family protein
MPPPARSKFLVIIDDTPECRLAARWAAIRAARTGGNVALLRILEPANFQHWATVGDLMREEAREDAEALLQAVGKQVVEWSGLTPEFIIREGLARDEIIGLVRNDRSIRVLALGAAASSEGPGPLVSSFTGSLVGELAIPVAVIPGNLSMEEIDDLA